MSDAEHRELVEVMLDLQGMVILSGYRNAIYGSLEEAGWLCVDLPTTCYAVGRTRVSGLQGPGSLTKIGVRHRRIETLWMSPATRPSVTAEMHAGSGWRGKFRRYYGYIQGRLDF